MTSFVDLSSDCQFSSISSVIVIDIATPLFLTLTSLPITTLHFLLQGLHLFLKFFVCFLQAVSILFCSRNWLNQWTSRSSASDSSAEVNDTSSNPINSSPLSEVLSNATSESHLMIFAAVCALLLLLLISIQARCCFASLSSFTFCLLASSAAAFAAWTLALVCCFFFSMTALPLGLGLCSECWRPGWVSRFVVGTLAFFSGAWLVSTLVSSVPQRCFSWDAFVVSFWLSVYACMAPVSVTFLPWWRFYAETTWFKTVQGKWWVVKLWWCGASLVGELLIFLALFAPQSSRTFHIFHRIPH